MGQNCDSTNQKIRISLDIFLTYVSSVKLKLLVFFKFSLKFQYCLVLCSRWLIDTNNSQCKNW